MKIVFYLPVVTANWLRDNVLPLIEIAAREAEVHVILPIYWSGTGLTDEQFSMCLGLDNVNWVILDQDDHPSYRIYPDSPQEILDYVGAVDPDYVFCRSADVITPASFPGKVVYLMEGEFAPSTSDTVPLGGRIVLSGPRFFDFGFMPDLTDAQWNWLENEIDPYWRTLIARSEQTSDRSFYRSEMGLPLDRKIIALPLQFQGQDNFSGLVHGSQNQPDEFVEALAQALGEDYLLAVSVHPIDYRLGFSPEIHRIAKLDPDRVRIVNFVDRNYRGEATELLIQHTDGLVISESKSISVGAFFGKPILRLSKFATADWMHAYQDPSVFAQAIRDGTAERPDRDAFKRWYAFHFANDAFPASEASFAELIDRAETPVNPERWAKSLARRYEHPDDHFTPTTQFIRVT